MAEATDGAIIRDQELKAINDIVKRLAALEPTARERVWTYLKNRFDAKE